MTLFLIVRISAARKYEYLGRDIKNNLMAMEDFRQAWAFSTENEAQKFFQTLMNSNMHLADFLRDFEVRQFVAEKIRSAN